MKYIIEIEDEAFVRQPCQYGEGWLYRAENNHSMIFDRNDLDKLKPYEADKAYWDGYKAGQESTQKPSGEQLYQRGLDDAWTCARRIAMYPQDGGMTTSELQEVFDREHEVGEILKEHTASEAIRKIKDYEQTQNGIKVGDEVQQKDEKWTAVVTKIEDGYMYLMTDDGTLVDDCKTDLFIKTGRSFPEIVEVQKAIMRKGDD